MEPVDPLIIAAAVITGLGLAFIWLPFRSIRHPALAMWGCAMVTAGVGLLLHAFSGLAPSGPLADCALVLAAGLSWTAARRLDARPAHWPLLLGGAALPGLLWSAARLPAPVGPAITGTAQDAVIILLGGVFSLGAAHSLHTARGAAGSIGHRLCSLLFALHGLAYVLRAGVIAAPDGWVPASLAQPESWQAVLIVEGLIHTVLTALLLLAMVFDRARMRQDLVFLQARGLAGVANRRLLEMLGKQMLQPLDDISALSQTLGVAGKATPAQRRSVMALEEAGRRLLGVVSDITDLAGVATGHLHVEADEISVGPFLAECSGAVQARAVMRRVRLAIDMEEGAPGLFEGDRARLRRVLITLLEEAVAATAPGGTVLLRARAGEAPGMLRFEVEDSAPAQVPTWQAMLDGGAMPRVDAAGLDTFLVPLLITAMGGRIGHAPHPERPGNVVRIDLATVAAPTVRQPGAAQGFPSLAEG